MAQLFVVPTPIGNLGDITFRAVEVLKSVDLILAEDTRTSGKLLKHYGIETPLRSHHMHNEHQLVESLAKSIQAGQSMALITDAGTPAISDPGFLLVRACIEIDVEVSCLPGATAFVPALVNSGLPNDKFVFEGFLPPKKGRQKRLTVLAEEERTMVLYESPYKLVKTLQQLVEKLGAERKISVARELTKLYEENVRGSVAEVLAHFEAHPPKGELVLVVEGKPKP